MSTKGQCRSPQNQYMQVILGQQQVTLGSAQLCRLCCIFQDHLVFNFPIYPPQQRKYSGIRGKQRPLKPEFWFIGGKYAPLCVCQSTCTKTSCTEEDDLTKQLLFLRISSPRTNYYSTSIVYDVVYNLLPPLMLPTSEYDVDYIYNGINMMNRSNTRLLHQTEEVKLPCVVVEPDLQTRQFKLKLNETSLNSFIYSIIVFLSGQFLLQLALSDVRNHET